MHSSALEGIKIADFSWSATGPVTTKYLADFGATVIHVESHKYLDLMRTSKPFKDNIANINRSAGFANLNSSKYGISLDMSKAKGQDIAWKLIHWSDAMVESFTPKVMKKWGLDYESVSKVKPEIVYLSTSVYGQYGPYANVKGWGFQASALSGHFDITGWPDRSPSGLFGAYSDFVNPPFGIVALLAALDYRRRKGKGQHIDQSQLEVSIQMLAPVVMDYFTNGRLMKRVGNRVSNAAPHGVYRCKGDDRWCAIAVFSQNEWERFCNVINRPAWINDPKFATLLDRKENEDEIDGLVEKWTINYTTEQVMTLMQDSGVAAGVVKDIRDLAEDPQLNYRGHYRRLEHTVMGFTTYDGPSFRLSKTPDYQSPAHALGEHNEYVYKEILHLSDDDIADLLAEGVITS